MLFCAKMKGYKNNSMSFSFQLYSERGHRGPPPGGERGGGGAVFGDFNQRHETLLMMHPYHFLSCIVYGVYVFVVTLEMSLILLYSRHYLGHNYGSCSNFHFSTRKKKKNEVQPSNSNDIFNFMRSYCQICTL